MIILKKNNHIDESKLDRNESILFIDMLRHELKRHQYEIYRAKEHAFYKFPYSNPLVSKFWECQTQNHKQDIDMIQKCINYLIEKWSLL